MVQSEVFDVKKGSVNTRVFEVKKGSLNQIKYCRDCEEAKVHSTGSQLWLSCRFQKGWRSINSQCNLPESSKRSDKLQ